MVPYTLLRLNRLIHKDHTTILDTYTGNGTLTRPSYVDVKVRRSFTPFRSPMEETIEIDPV